MDFDDHKKLMKKNMEDGRHNSCWCSWVVLLIELYCSFNDAFPTASHHLLSVLDTVGWESGWEPDCKEWVMRCWCGYLSEARSSWYHCHPIASCFIKTQIRLTFLVPAYPGCPGIRGHWMGICLPTTNHLWYLTLQCTLTMLARWLEGHQACKKTCLTVPEVRFWVTQRHLE